jgi:cyanophycinase
MPDRHPHPSAPGKGSLIIIGGHEDKTGPRVILREVARRVAHGQLVIMTVASHQPEAMFDTYHRVFQDLGVKHVRELRVEEREDARREENYRLLDDATGVFFTGGDQLRITSQLGDTPIYGRIQDIYENGGLICGTSAGASVMCETMLVSGDAGESYRVGDLQMAPGFGLIRGVVIDQHFAERGRMGRLLGAVSKNPRHIGIGIDENTAIVVEHGAYFTVLGAGAVYVVDGTGITQSNIAEAAQDQVLSVTDVRLHVLASGNAYDLVFREPVPAEQVKRREPARQDE